MQNHTLREESERVSELKSMSGSSKLPFGTLAMGAEGIKDAIKGFDDAWALFTCFRQVLVTDRYLAFIPGLDVNRTLKTSDYPPTWSTRTQKRARRISHHHCPRLRRRTPTQSASSRQMASRQLWRRRFRVHPRAQLVPPRRRRLSLGR